MSERKETLRQYLLEAHQKTWPVLSSLQPEDLAAAVYGDGEIRWTVREILGHLADAEPGLLGQGGRVGAGGGSGAGGARAPVEARGRLPGSAGFPGWVGRVGAGPARPPLQRGDPFGRGLPA